MDVEKLITETLTAHEKDVPDPEPVLAATRRRIERRRTVLSRPLAVAAGVVVLSLAAVAVVALNRSGSADGAGTAAPAGGATTPVHKAPAKPKPKPGDLRMPFSLGWLPPGSVAYVARRVNIGAASDAPDSPPLYGGEYMLTVTADDQVLDVDVQQMRMVQVGEAAFKSGPGSPVTINGQRGVESSHSDGLGGYELYVAHPDGGSMYVNVSAGPGSTFPTQQLINVGRRVAQNIRFPGTTTVTPAFSLRALPRGMRICAFDVEEGLRTSPAPSEINTSYSLGTCATMPPINLNAADLPVPDGTPGRPVQGHKTSTRDDDGYRSLWVLDAIGDVPVSIAGRVPLADLYDIANRLVLPPY